MTFIDSHCHLDDEQFAGDREAVIQRALDAGVQTMLAIGTGEGPPDLGTALRLAGRYPHVFATVGVHPQHAARATDSTFFELRDKLQHPKCLGIGEIGLDYYWKPYDPEQQKRVFREQLEIAADASMPVSIHTRDAWADTIALLRDHWVPTGLPCVLHCFTGGPEQAAEALSLGFYLSFAGIVTYPKATEVQAAARSAPLDRILVETDAPYLPPVPHRGKRNEPAYVVHTVTHLAALRNQPVAAVTAAVAANFHRVFQPADNLPPEPNKTNQLH